MRAFLRDNGLALFFLGIFLASLVGQSLAGQRVYNQEQLAHGDSPVSYLRYVTSSDFGQAVMENWQSEFLQFVVFILATIWLVQRGSAESKRPDEPDRREDEDGELEELRLPVLHHGLAEVGRGDVAGPRDRAPAVLDLLLVVDLVPGERLADE